MTGRMGASVSNPAGEAPNSRVDSATQAARLSANFQTGLAPSGTNEHLSVVVSDQAEARGEKVTEARKQQEERILRKKEELLLSYQREDDAAAAKK